MDNPLQSLKSITATRIYVAFLDVLGFSQRIEQRWDQALANYDALIEAVDGAQRAFDGLVNTSVQMISDSVLVKGAELIDVVRTTQFILCGAIRSRCLIRGAIAHGEHIERQLGNHLHVLSKALVRAAAAEKKAIHPRVIIDTSSVAEIAEWYRPAPPGMSNVVRMVVWKDGYWCVNPFSLVWFRSAVEIVDEMRRENIGTRHQTKYDWFFQFAQSVATGEPMLPGVPTRDAEGSNEKLWITDPEVWKRR